MRQAGRWSASVVLICMTACSPETVPAAPASPPRSTTMANGLSRAAGAPSTQPGATGAGASALAPPPSSPTVTSLAGANAVGATIPVAGFAAQAGASGAYAGAGGAAGAQAGAGGMTTSRPGTSGRNRTRGRTAGAGGN